MTAHPQLAGIVLAAGASTRLGAAKQLLTAQTGDAGRTLVADAVSKAKAICGAGTFVVTGAQHELVTAELSDYGVEIVFNPAWETGLASSLRAGMGVMQQQVEGALIMLCDQPLIETADLAQLAELWLSSRDQPVATRYNNGAGVPAIIPASMFAQTVGLDGDQGARGLLAQLPAERLLEIRGAELDIDTPADLERYIQKSQNNKI